MYNANMLGANIKALRLEREMTQAELAERVHITPQNISKWERGLCLPDVEKLCILADVLGVSTDVLLSPMDNSDECSLIAIDGGGTKTEFCLFSKNGEVKERLVLGATNPNAVGMQTSLKLLKSGIDALLAHRNNVEVIYAGISGCGFIEKNKQCIKEHLEKCYPEVKIIADGDMPNVIYSTEYFEQCIVAIMGTGSVVAVKNADGIHRIGGWGYLYDEGFSGFGIGRDAVLAALRDEDGVGEKTMLTEAIRSRLGGGIVSNLGVLYSDNNAKIPSFAPLVFNACRSGDDVADKILKNRLDVLLSTITRAAELYGGGKHVVLAGGLISEREIIEKHLSSSPFEIHFPTLPQIYGAANRCIRAIGVPCLDFTDNFEKTYQEIKAKGEK